MKVVALAKIIGTFILLAFVNTQQIVNKIIDDNNIQKQSKQTTILSSEGQNHSNQYIKQAANTQEDIIPFDLHGTVRQQHKKQYQARLSQQSNAAYEHYRKQQEDRQRKQQQQRLKLAQQIKLTAAQQMQARQNQEMQQQYNKLANRTSRQFNQYCFNLGISQTQDFKINIPINQQIVFFVQIFKSKDGIFSPATEIYSELPLQLYTFQNKVKIVYQKKMYFRAFGNINGEANSSYIFRFVNQGGQRLIFFRLMIILEKNHVYDLVTKQDVAQHAVRLIKITKQISEKLSQLGNKFMLQNQNNKKLVKQMSNYYTYNTLEIALIAAFCMIQVEFIRKLLQNNIII